MCGFARALRRIPRCRHQGFTLEGTDACPRFDCAVAARRCWRPPATSRRSRTPQVREQGSEIVPLIWSEKHIDIRQDIVRIRQRKPG